MKFVPTLHLLALASLGALLSGPASAQALNPDYVGLSVGRSTAQLEEERIAAAILGSAMSVSSITHNRHDTAYKLFAGHRFNRYFGIEAGYFDLGQFTFNATTVPAGTLEGRIRVRGINLDALGTLPLTESLSAIARVGVQRARTTDDFTGTGAVFVGVPRTSKDDTHYKLGLGAQFAFSPALQVRGEIERFRSADAVGYSGNVNVLSASLLYAFGGSGATQPSRSNTAYVAPAPAPVAPPAPPVARVEPPVVMQPPPPPPAPPAPAPRKRVSFSAEALFGFDKAAMLPSGAAELDGFRRELDGTEYLKIKVEGHTDRLGTPAYNQKLSLERAQTVKDYLVNTARLDPAKIDIVGVGETQPATRTEDCQGAKPGPALVKCLQPDRRVEIEVFGTR